MHPATSSYLLLYFCWLSYPISSITCVARAAEVLVADDSFLSLPHLSRQNLNKDNSESCGDSLDIGEFVGRNSCEDFYPLGIPVCLFVSFLSFLKSSLLSLFISV